MGGRFIAPSFIQGGERIRGCVSPRLVASGNFWCRGVSRVASQCCSEIKVFKATNTLSCREMKLSEELVESFVHWQNKTPVKLLLSDVGAEWNYL